MPALLRRAADPRTGLYLTLGAALVAPASVGLAGCQDAAEPDPPAEALAVTGVETVIQQLPDGSYQIADEQVVEGRTGGVTIIHQDPSAPGGTRTERLDSPEAFAARLPATPPDSAGLGAGGSWGSNGAPSEQNAVARSGSGFGLGDALLMTALFNMWRPPIYAGYGYAAPSRAYTTSAVRERSRSAVAPRLAAAGRRGTLATPSRVQSVQRAAATRASRPSGGRSGGFSRGFGRGGG